MDNVYLGIHVYWYILFGTVLSMVEQSNILFLVVDDLRPELGIYSGSNDALYPGILTPNIDSLAENSLVFMHAYSQFPLCGPSRTSFLTGRRPDTTKVLRNGDNWRDVGGNFTSLPQHLKENGYVTYASGKVFHGQNVDNEYSWSEENYLSSTDDFWNFDGNCWGIAEPEIYNRIPLPDMQIRDYAIQTLRQLPNISQPFFLAVGFKKPHTPYLAPRMFFEKYSEDDIELPKNPYVPLNYPEVAWTGWRGVANCTDISKYDNSYNQSLPDNVTLDLRLAYYASVSYIDSLVGDVLEELELQSLDNNTIIVFLADHGYKLGEHSNWSKRTTLEVDTRIPMMLKVPGVTDLGRTTDVLVENVDIFSTLVDLVGLEPVPPCPEDSSEILLCTEGYSMVDLLVSDPDEWKSAIFNIYQLGGNMSYSIRTEQYAYARWMYYVNGTFDWDIIIAEELYDLINDPNQLENVAGYPEFAAMQEELYERLRAGWREALPSPKFVSDF